VDNNASNIAIHDNLVGGNGGDGIAILGSPNPGTSLVANGIGIGASGTPLGNAGHGIRVAGSALGVFVGKRYRLAPPMTASISNNGGAGLFVDDVAQVDVVNASVGGNSGLAIDLAPLGATPNDAGDGDGGPNEGLNKPVIESAILDVSTLTTTITGTLSAAPSSSYELHFYISTSCDASGFGGGQAFFPLSPPPVVVSVVTDVSGNANVTRQTSGLGAGVFLTALTRRFATTPGPAALIVSEFSACRQVTSSADLIFADGFDA
jgi:hypothetical protein